MEDLRAKLRKAGSVAVLTGAGVSAESGIPTFRGNGGLWRQFRAEDLATPEAFDRDPELVWQWYNWRRGLVAKAQPNPGHDALAALEKQSRKFTLITQNVDDLHERAGSQNVLHVHGSIWKTRCLECGKEAFDMRSPLPEIPPRCECAGLLRPGVVWFGETLPSDVWAHAEQAARSAEVFLVAGTSAAVYPAAGLAHLAQAHGAFVIAVNLEPTGVTSGAARFVQGSSGTVLPQLLS